MSPGEPLSPLPDLAAHVLALVADPLALVRLGRAHLANLGGGLPDLLLVDALDDDLRVGRNLERDSLTRFHYDRVRVADVEPEISALQRGAIANALQLEALLEALGDALDHVRDQRPRQTVQRAIVAALGRPGDDDRPFSLLDLHPGGNLLRELSERAVDHHAARGDRDVHAGWKLDWLSTDSTHLVTRRSKRLRRRFLSLPRCAR